MPAKFHEIPSMGLQDIKETKRYGQTDGRTDAHTDARTDARTDGQRENSIPPLKLRFGGGYNDSCASCFISVPCFIEKSLMVFVL